MINKTLKEIIMDWYNEAGLNPRETIAFHCCEGKLYIITQYPGIMIGYRGKLVFKYEEILKENGYGYKISFVDIFSGKVKEF